MLPEHTSPTGDTALERGVFIATLGTTLIAEQLLWDGQFITYPMFRRIRDLDEQVFVQVHRDYVRSLGLPTYMPMILYLVSCLLLLFVRPKHIPGGYPLVMNLLNLAGIVSTFTQLVPNHVRIDTSGQASAKAVQRLIDDNRLRFGVVGINSAIMIFLLARQLRAGRLHEHSVGIRK